MTQIICIILVDLIKTKYTGNIQHNLEKNTKDQREAVKGFITSMGDLGELLYYTPDFLGVGPVKLQYLLKIKANFLIIEIFMIAQSIFPSINYHDSGRFHLTSLIPRDPSSKYYDSSWNGGPNLGLYRS